MSDRKDAVSFTVFFGHQGQHYEGVAAMDGVGFELVDAPCGYARQMISFTNCAYAPKGIFMDSVSALVADEPAIRGYLKLRPDA
jgi:hypothetical protein